MGDGVCVENNFPIWPPLSHWMPCATICSREHTHFVPNVRSNAYFNYTFDIIIIICMGFRGNSSSFTYTTYIVFFFFYIFRVCLVCACVWHLVRRLVLGVLVVHTVVVTRSKTRSRVQMKCLFSKRQQCNKNFSLATTQLFYALACSHFVPYVVVFWLCIHFIHVRFSLIARVDRLSLISNGFNAQKTKEKKNPRKTTGKMYCTRCPDDIAFGVCNIFNLRSTFKLALGCGIDSAENV